MGSLNHFSRVLREKEWGFRVQPSIKWPIGVVTFVVILAMVGGAVLEQPLIGFLVGAGIAVSFGMGYAQAASDQALDRSAEAFDSEIAELLRELFWMENSKQLSERTHPKLVLLLERATLARNEIIVAMKSEEWVRKGKQEPWKEVRDGCLRTADEGWADVAWLGRNLFRRKGWRRDTFDRNCADPEFGKRALRAAESVVEALEHLAANVKGESETNQSVISRTRKRLEELMAAEAELGEEPEFLRHLD